DYAKNTSAKKAFSTVDCGISEEFSRINEARVNTPHNAPRKTLPTIIKDHKLCAAFKDYLRKTDKGGMVRYVELYGFCLLRPKGDAADKVCQEYKNLDPGLEGFTSIQEFDDNRWAQILNRVEQRLSPVHEPFMKSPEYAKACGV